MEATAAPAAVPDSVPQSEPQQTAPQEPKKWKVKIDQEEAEVDEQELVRGYQRAKSANKRFEEASRLYKEAAPYLTAKQKGDLNTLLSDLPDEKKREWAENYLGEWLRLQQMDPTERENLEYKKKLEQYEKEKSEREQEERSQAEKAQRQQLALQAKSEIDTQIAEAVKSSGLKPTPRLIARIADEMLISHNARGERLPASEAMKRADQALRGDVQSLISEMPTDKLVDYLGKDIINKILRHSTDQVRSNSPFGKPQAPKQETREPVKSEGKKTDDYFAQLEKRYTQRRK
jgi:hypothetical protein